jgi:hypothetical protein
MLKRFAAITVVALPLALGACAGTGGIGVEYVQLEPDVRALYRPGADEPFRYEIRQQNTMEWYEAVQVAENRFALTNQGRYRYWQDLVRGDDWDR